MSKLAAFSEKLIEAGWLAAIIVAPLFFDIYSSRVFEPDKVSLVRTLALVMLAAWLVGRIEAYRIRTSTGSSKDGSARLVWSERIRAILTEWSHENPLTLPTLLLVAVYILSTAASVSPSVSLLGSYQRLQGLYTTLSYIVIFFLAASTIRSAAQVERAISVALVVSFPIALYGIIQHYFLDPLPWAGDVTSRVASNMGNSIFVGAYLILIVPLAFGRLIGNARQVAAQTNSGAGRRVLYASVIASVLVLAGAWSLSFELGAKRLIEAGYTGTLTPEMLAATSSNFNLALGVSFLVVLGWIAAAVALKKSVTTFLLIGTYALLLALQVVCILFTQSRGPLLGLLGAFFTFGVLYALVRGARRIALSAVGAAVMVAAFLALFNLAAASPLAPLREAPYIGRLGRVFETEGGTGKVRVLIWEGALKLVLPHAPLWSPTGGTDALNFVRPLIGYGPESMYVAYSQFYPPDLAHLESRSATPDRSHNETFDALVNTGLFGLAAEILLFISVFYYGLKWLGFINTPGERNAFVALWLVSGVIISLIFGLSFGWQFVGVALPAGMIVGFFIYLVAFALLRPRAIQSDETSARTLLIVTILSALVAHFIEIHFGIAIVSTRTYFWFLSAVLVAVGVNRALTSGATLHASMREVSTEREEKGATTSKARRKKRRTPRENVPPPIRSARDNGITTAPLIAFAFIAGLILATMAFDYINTNSLSGDGTRTLDIVVSALTTRRTTAGLESSNAMLWLFVGTLLIMLVIGVGEWARGLTLRPREWLIAAGLFTVLALAIFTSFLFYHLLLIGTTGSAIFDALLSAVGLFVLFMIIMVVVVALALLFDVTLPNLVFARPSNVIVAPGLALIAALVIFATNVSIVQADLIYKQAASLPGGQNPDLAIALYQRALAMQPTQDYYLLFLGRAYLDAAKSAKDAVPREQDLAEAEQALLKAQALNPLNTDHTANLARLHQAWATLSTDPAAQEGHFKKSLDYYAQAIRLSPNTAHLYDQYAQGLLDYSDFLTSQKNTAAANQRKQEAQATIAQALSIDSTFCLTYATRARVQDNWDASAKDALQALELAPQCGDAYSQEGSGLALQALSLAGDRAQEKGQGSAYASMLEAEARTQPSVELYTALANYYSKAGQIDPAVRAIDGALAQLGTSDSDTRKRYEDFRKGLVSLQQSINAANSAPNDPEAHRALAKAWMARGQTELALPEYQKVLQLLPNDYEAQRYITLLLVKANLLADASRAITRTLALAPASEQLFWNRLATVLNAAQSGQTSIALSRLQELVKSVDPGDLVTLDALNTLTAKLRGQG